MPQSFATAQRSRHLPRVSSVCLFLKFSASSFLFPPCQPGTEYTPTLHLRLNPTYVTSGNLCNRVVHERVRNNVNRQTEFLFYHLAIFKERESSLKVHVVLLLASLILLSSKGRAEFLTPWVWAGLDAQTSKESILSEGEQLWRLGQTGLWSFLLAPALLHGEETEQRIESPTWWGTEAFYKQASLWLGSLGSRFSSRSQTPLPISWVQPPAQNLGQNQSDY